MRNLAKTARYLRWILAPLGCIGGVALLAYAAVQRDEWLVPIAYLVLAIAVLIGLYGGRLAAFLEKTRRIS